jgi:hypothetical protein
LVQRTGANCGVHSKGARKSEQTWSGGLSAAMLRADRYNASFASGSYETHKEIIL